MVGRGRWKEMARRDRIDADTFDEPLSARVLRYKEFAKTSQEQAEECAGLRRNEQLTEAAGWQAMAKGLERALSRLTALGN